MNCVQRIDKEPERVKTSVGENKMNECIEDRVAQNI